MSRATPSLVVLYTIPYAVGVLLMGLCDPVMR
jgi:hypothetical protein